MIYNFLDYCHVYLMALLRPGKIHAWMRHGIPPWEGSEDAPPLALAPSLGLSWAAAVVQGLFKLLLMNVLLELLANFRAEFGLLDGMVSQNASLIPYYLVLFSTTLDLVFFPVLTLVLTQLWNWVIRVFAHLMGFEGDIDEAADQITVVALSSNFFLILPIVGIFLQKLAWLVLMYSGLRRNLEASRSLAVVILIAPTVVTLMILASLLLVAFCLFAI